MKLTIKITIGLLALFLITLAIGAVRARNPNLITNQDFFDPETNLLANSAVSVSSQGGLFASRAIDSSKQSAWRGLKRNGTSITADLGSAKTFDTAVLREKGLNIQEFRLQISDDGENWTGIYKQNKIEPYRMATFAEVSARYIRLVIDTADRLPDISSFELYHVGAIEREKPFRVTAYISMGHLYDVLLNPDLTAQERDDIFDTKYFDTVTDAFFIFDIRYDEHGNIQYGSGKEAYTKAVQEFHKMIGKRDVNIFTTILNPHDNALVMEAITTNRENLLTNMIAFAKEHNLDGIDLDWEFPFTQEEFDAYNSFLRDLKSRLVSDLNPDAQLSTALATWALRYEQETIDIIDQVQVMGYDIVDQDGQHAAFYGGVVQPAQYILEQGFTKDQINLGVPFYGTYKEGRMEQYLYNGTTPEQRDYWKNAYQMPAYENSTKGTVYFNSPAMLKDKVAYALASDMGGVMIFSLYCDIPYAEPLSLTRAMEEALQDRLAGYKAGDKFAHINGSADTLASTTAGKGE